MKGDPLVQEVVHELEDIVNRVAKSVVGEETIVCGKSARWWDNEIKDKIRRRCQVCKKVVSGRKELWDEYCRLRKEVKEAVREKKLSIWNEVVEKVNADFEEGSRKEFWAFVGWRTKGKYKNIASLKSKAGVTVTSTQGKLEAQGCSLSPILFSVFIDDLLWEVEKADLGIQLGDGKKVGGMLFADDFVGVSGSKEGLQKLISVVH